MNSLYLSRGTLMIGFHGCEKSVAHELVTNPNKIKVSSNSYDWLGTGFYVWENNYERALKWAQDTKKEDPAVLGVIYDLGYCLDLMDSSCIELLSAAYEQMKKDMASNNIPFPSNQDASFDENHDKLKRNLDCALVNYLTTLMETSYQKQIKARGYAELTPFDTVRGCFTEGKKIFDTEIYEKTHIQICIRNLNCIKGFFLPRNPIKFP